MTSEKIDILWRDETALAINKPSGLLVHNSRFAGPKELSICQMIKEQIGGEVSPIHRLDRGASGVLLFVTDRSTACHWQNRLSDPSSEKVYLALVRGHVAKSVYLDYPVKDDEGIRRDARSDIAPVLESSIERCSLVRVRLHTGRMHQARLHLRHLSHPIIGDTSHGPGEINRYYRANYELRRLALHSWFLFLIHPLSQKPLFIEAPIPFSLLTILERLFPEHDLQHILAHHKPEPNE